MALPASPWCPCRRKRAGRADREEARGPVARADLDVVAPNLGLRHAHILLRALFVWQLLRSVHNVREQMVCALLEYACILQLAAWTCRYHRPQGRRAVIHTFVGPRAEIGLLHRQAALHGLLEEQMEEIVALVPRSALNAKKITLARDQIDNEVASLAFIGEVGDGQGIQRRHMHSLVYAKATGHDTTLR